MNLTDLYHLLLPKEIQDYFEIVKTEQLEKEQRVNIYLEEKNELPAGYAKADYESKGFHNEITVQDFPLRGKAAYLLIKRRRWRNKTTGEIIERDWQLVAEGTRITQDFAAFLKEFDRYKNRHNK
jgi:altronate dehydratase